MSTHSPASLKHQERLWRRLRRQPILLLSAQIRPDAPLKIFTVHRTLTILPCGSIEQWFGTLGGHDRHDPYFGSAARARSHALSLTFAADNRRWGNYDRARRLIARARKTRLEHPL